MTPRELLIEINKFTASMWRAGLAKDSNVAVIEEVGGGHVSVVWKATESLEIDFGERPSWREYIEWVKARQYNVLLSDYSFMQMSYVLRDNTIVRHRLVYYPCPVAMDLEERGELGIVDLLDMLGESRELLDRLRQETPLRFEFDLTAAKEGHPASHLHVSRESCRIPVHAPLSLGRFIRFIFCHFYPTEWTAHSFLRDWPCGTAEPTIAEAERRELHLACLE